MTQEHIKELISKVYVNALAAHAGMTVAVSYFDYGIDGTFKDIEYIDIPLSQQLTPEKLTEMMKRVKKGTLL